MSRRQFAKSPGRPKFVNGGWRGHRAVSGDAEGCIWLRMTCASDTSASRRLGRNTRKSTHSTHGLMSSKRLSRQAIAALRPSRRAISMNFALSGEPAPSMSRSMARASSSAGSIFCAS